MFKEHEPDNLTFRQGKETNALVEALEDDSSYVPIVKAKKKKKRPPVFFKAIPKTAFQKVRSLAEDRCLRSEIGKPLRQQKKRNYKVSTRFDLSTVLTYEETPSRRILNNMPPRKQVPVPSVCHEKASSKVLTNLFDKPYDERQLIKIKTMLTQRLGDESLWRTVGRLHHLVKAAYDEKIRSNAKAISPPPTVVAPEDVSSKPKAKTRAKAKTKKRTSSRVTTRSSAKTPKSPRNKTL